MRDEITWHWRSKKRAMRINLRSILCAIEVKKWMLHIDIKIKNTHIYSDSRNDGMQKGAVTESGAHLQNFKKSKAQEKYLFLFYFCLHVAVQHVKKKKINNCGWRTQCQHQNDKAFDD